MQVGNAFAQTADDGRLADCRGTGQHDHASVATHRLITQRSIAVRPSPALIRREVELFQQGLALTIAEAAQAAGRGDLELGHDLLRLDLADLRQGLEQRGNLHLAQDLVGLSVLEDLLEVGAATLEPIFELSSQLDVRQQPSPTLPRAVRRSTGEGPRVPPSLAI